MVFSLGFGVFTTVAQVHPWVRKLRAHKWLSMAKRGGGRVQMNLFTKQKYLQKATLLLPKWGVIS